MLLSAVSVLVVAQPSSEIPEGLMNYPVCSVVSRDTSLFSDLQLLDNCPKRAETCSTEAIVNKTVIVCIT